MPQLSKRYATRAGKKAYREERRRKRSRGWYGEKTRHSNAAKLGWLRKRMRRGSLKEIPVKTSNKSIKVSKAQYNPKTKTTNVALVDEDKQKITYLIEDIPMEAENIEVEEKGDLGLTMKSQGKKKTGTLVIIEQPKDV